MLDKVHSKIEDGAPGRFSGNGGNALPPRGEDGVERPYEDEELENAADQDNTEGADPADDDFDDERDEKPTDQEFLQMVTEANSQAAFYSNQINRRAWERAYKAFRQEHFQGSKYTTPDFRNRSRLFIPKTRVAIRKDLAATSASLFGTVDPIECSGGNEADPRQRGGAALIKELLSYRCDSANGSKALPWFLTAMGARQTSLLTGFCVSKQSWKLEMKRKGTEDVPGEEGRTRDVWVPGIDRPDSQVIPPENCTIDPACDWTNPAQDSAYFIIKWPMRIDEIKRRQRDPRNPWKKVSDQVLRSGAEGARMDAATIRRARDQGLDRFEQASGSQNFDVIWVYETYIRTAGEDWTFFSVADKVMLTDPAPVEQVYPEQGGERPITMGYGSFEAFCVFPQAAVESWQMLQQESNDVRNLTLDAFKQNVMPVTKVVRGRQIDLDQLKRRGQGTSIMVNSKDDVTWERPPDVPMAAQAIKQQLDIEFDELAGQQNYGTVQDNNALGKTLGGLKLAAGAANAVQEFDIRVWIETWAERAVRQLVRLEQFYESDEVVLGIAGERAELFKKHGINEIDDQLIEQDVSVKVSIGLGAGDPQQVLQKFQAAATIAQPLLAMDPRFVSGELSIDGEAVMAETFGRGAGFRDGGKRFIRKGEAKGADPTIGAKVADLAASTELKKAQAKKAVLDALSNAAKVGIALSDMELDKARHLFDLHHDHVEQVGRAQEMGHQHGKDIADRQQAAKGLNPDGTPIQPPGEMGDVPPGGAGAPPAGDAMPGQPPGLETPPGLPEPKPPAAAEAPKRSRNVTITARDKDGRATGFKIED